MRLQLHAALDYGLPHVTDILLQIEAAQLPEQSVIQSSLVLSDHQHMARVVAHDGVGERIFLRADSRLTAHYHATVEINRRVSDIFLMEEVPPHKLPGEAVQYLLDSCYCPANQFRHFVDGEFGPLRGGERIAAIRDFIHRSFRYVPGSSSATTTALDTFVRREGVCRDFAHMMITLARASTIPARFASVYALGVEPQDFHAVAEVFLDGEWHLVDATGMATEGMMAKIGIGRDAADVAFLTSFGAIEMVSQTVMVCEEQVRAA
jgi:transglutaminase-like putative cysteine protease